MDWQLWTEETPRTLGLRSGPAWVTDSETGQVRYLDLRTEDWAAREGRGAINPSLNLPQTPLPPDIFGN